MKIDKIDVLRMAMINHGIDNWFTKASFRRDVIKPNRWILGQDRLRFALIDLIKHGLIESQKVDGKTHRFRSTQKAVELVEDVASALEVAGELDKV